MLSTYSGFPLQEFITNNVNFNRRSNFAGWDDTRNANGNYPK